MGQFTPQYFIHAINSLPEDHQYRFWFISEGFDFVKQEILPSIDADCICAEGNAQDYEDFWLLCQCDIIIGSQSSWGATAYQMNRNTPKQLITYPHEFIDENDPGTVLIALTKDMYLQ